MAGKTSEYYANHPEARKKHRASSAKAQKTPAAKRKRVECNEFNRKNGKKGDKMDCSHKNGRLVLEHQSKNRARK